VHVPEPHPHCVLEPDPEPHPHCVPQTLGWCFSLLGYKASKVVARAHSYSPREIGNVDNPDSI